MLDILVSINEILNKAKDKKTAHPYTEWADTFKLFYFIDVVGFLHPKRF